MSGTLTNGVRLRELPVFLAVTSVRVSFLNHYDKYLRTSRKTDLLWLMVLDMLTYGWLALSLWVCGETERMAVRVEGGVERKSQVEEPGTRTISPGHASSDLFPPTGTHLLIMPSHELIKWLIHWYARSIIRCQSLVHNWGLWESQVCNNEPFLEAVHALIPPSQMKMRILCRMIQDWNTNLYLF